MNETHARRLTEWMKSTTDLVRLQGVAIQAMANVLPRGQQESFVRERQRLSKLYCMNPDTGELLEDEETRTTQYSEQIERWKKIYGAKPKNNEGG